MEELKNLTTFQFQNLNLGEKLLYFDVNRQKILPHVLNKRFCEDAERSQRQTLVNTDSVKTTGMSLTLKNRASYI
jgi:hypothetical protein